MTSSPRLSHLKQILQLRGHGQNVAVGTDLLSRCRESACRSVSVLKMLVSVVSFSLPVMKSRNFTVIVFLSPNSSRNAFKVTQDQWQMTYALILVLALCHQSLWSWPLTFLPLICPLSYSWYRPLSYQFRTLVLFIGSRHGTHTDRQTDRRGAILTRPLLGPISILLEQMKNVNVKCNTTANTIIRNTD